MGLLFLGLESNKQPTMDTEFLRLLNKYLQDYPHIALQPNSEVKMLLNRGEITVPKVNLSNSRKLSETWGDQCFASAVLESPKNQVQKVAWKPWLLEYRMNQSLYLKLALGSETGYRFHNRVEAQILCGKFGVSHELDPMQRARCTEDLIDSLAKNTARAISVSLAGVNSKQIGRKEKVRPESRSSQGELQIKLGEPPISDKTKDNEKGSSQEKPGVKAKAANDLEIPNF